MWSRGSGGRDPLPFSELHPPVLVLWSSPQLSCRPALGWATVVRLSWPGALLLWSPLQRPHPIMQTLRGHHQPGYLCPAIPAPTGVQHSSHTSQYCTCTR